MKYDFETLVDRSHCGSGKWDGMRQKKPERTWSLKMPLKLPRV